MYFSLYQLSLIDACDDSNFWSSWFQLPSIEILLKSPPVGRDQKRPPIVVLIICPTRELASQAAAEANTLLKYHPSLGVQVVIGGTRFTLEQKRMQANHCQVSFFIIREQVSCINWMSCPLLFLPFGCKMRMVRGGPRKMRGKGRKMIPYFYWAIRSRVIATWMCCRHAYHLKSLIKANYFHLEIVNWEIY